MSTYRDQLIFEALRHPASAKLREPLYRTTKPRKIQQIAAKIARISNWKGNKEKGSIYKGIELAAKKRADEKDVQNIPGIRHSTRGHLSVSDAPPVYKSNRGEYISLEQQSREARASREGYFGKKLTTKNPKKQRKDEALRKMARTGLPKSGYGDWSKEKLKEAYYNILCYLLDEGYTDSEYGAEFILENMSDEWMAEILDEKYVGWRGGKLSGGDSPRRRALNTQKRLKMQLRQNPTDPKLGKKYSNATRAINSMDSHTDPLNVIIRPSLSVKKDPMMHRGEPNTERHQKGIDRRNPDLFDPNRRYRDTRSVRAKYDYR